MTTTKKETIVQDENKEGITESSQEIKKLL